MTQIIKTTENGKSYWEKSGAYTKEMDKLYDELVPAEGAAATLTGEIVRAANRLYYAAYYAVSSLLIAARIESKTHEGIIRMFSKEFVMTKRMDTRFGRIYNDLYTKRITGDYGDSFDVTEEDVRPMVNPTKELISCVKEQIEIIRNKTNN